MKGIAALVLGMSLATPALVDDVKREAREVAEFALRCGDKFDDSGWVKNYPHNALYTFTIPVTGYELHFTYLDGNTPKRPNATPNGEVENDEYFQVMKYPEGSNRYVGYLGCDLSLEGLDSKHCDPENIELTLDLLKEIKKHAEKKCSIRS